MQLKAVDEYNNGLQFLQLFFPESDPVRRLRFKGGVAAIGAAVGVSGGGRAVAARSTPVFGEDFGCPLAHHGHHLQRYFPKPIFGNHFTVKCENGDLTFCRF